MKCRECDEGVIDSTGKCTECGCLSYGQMPAAVGVDYSEGSPGRRNEEEIPAWRVELSKRLQETKKKKQSQEIIDSAARVSAPVTQLPRMQAVSPPRVDPPARIVEKARTQRTPKKPSLPLPQQKTLQLTDQAPLGGKPSSDADDPERIQRLIDNVILRQEIAEEYAERCDLPAQHRWQEDAPDQEGKLILLSRTLSGLVDLICVVLLTGIFILSADFFSGILFIDTLSIISFSGLFLLIYFVYSLFFMATSYQTLGMMITDLHVVGSGGHKPSFGRLLGRCAGYLVSLFGFGIGLVLSLFNRENRCLHDLLSGTRVVRM
ncbi:MAG TPA: RDD family protein [Acidobacteriota bacterium]|nr:RDD family protein [Acidobacteriota bacterium]